MTDRGSSMYPGQPDQHASGTSAAPHGGPARKFQPRVEGEEGDPTRVDFVIGAVITPTPDPINQTIVSLPIYFLFELGVILARFA